MVNNQYQSHTGSDGSSPDQRMEQAGYTDASSTGENAYAYSTSVDEAMQAFLLDWGVSDQGHRRNLLQANVSLEQLVPRHRHRHRQHERTPSSARW